MRVLSLTRIMQLTPCFIIALCTGCMSIGGDSSNLPRLGTANESKAPRREERIANWQRIADLPGDGFGYGIQCVGERFCWLYDSKKLWESRDAGATWSLVHAIAEKDDPEEYHLVSERVGWKHSHLGVFKTMDGGRTWIRKSTPLDSLDGEVRSIWFLTDTKTGWLGGGAFRPQTEEELKFGVANNTKDVTGKKVLEEAILRSDDGGETWQRQTLPVGGGWGRLLAIKFFDENHGVAVGGVDLYYTSDGGKSWKSPSFKKTCVLKEYLSDYYDARPLDVEMPNSKEWWISFNDGRIAKSVDGGRSWCDLLHAGKVAFEDLGREGFIKLHFVTPQEGWGLGVDRFVYETKDGGKSWNRLTSEIKFDSMFFLNHKHGLLVSKQGLFRMEQ